MEKNKMVWKKPKYNLREYITSLFMETEAEQIEKEAQRQLLKETEEREKFKTQLQQARQRGRETTTKKGLLNGIFNSLTDLGSNVNHNMTQKNRKTHRRSEPDQILEGYI